MASLIKNQILKHLSKFTKNLSADKINVSTLKGEGDLSNLELDEAVLMEVLDLPTWMRLKTATCNRLSIKIQWTKLKTQPIMIFLDEIVVEMETCDKPRDPPTAAQLSAYGIQPTKYGFAERIIDGMFVSINSVIVNFKAPAFDSSIQISRILVSSKTPLWQNGDLRLTRVKDDLRDEILIFKEVEWQTLRIEANAMGGSDDPNLATTPLRLIANQSKTRITIKKRLSDCGIIASRVHLNLDDLLWVLTDSQLKAAILFANSLREVIKKSTQQSKQRAAEKLQVPGSGQQKQQQRPSTKSQIQMAKLFARYDIQETSYHLHTGRIDLHLCDDMAPAHEKHIDTAEGTYKRKVDGGAMQITFHRLALDYYPFHPAGTDRSHWLHYDENMMARSTWAQDLLNVFKDDVRKVREAFVNSPPSSPEHKAAPRSQPVGQGQRGHTSQQTGPPGRSRASTKLLESCFVMRLEDFVLYRVSTANDNKRMAPKKFIASDKKQLLLPPEMSSVHMEYTDYYFPEGVDYPENKVSEKEEKKKWRKKPKIEKPLSEEEDEFHDLCMVPHPNLYVVLNPLRINIDYLTIVWLNAFTLNLMQSLHLPESEGPQIHVDTRLDALMPRVILPSESGVTGQADRPGALQLQVSKLTLTNIRIDPKAQYTQLQSVLTPIEDAHLFYHSHFPNDQSDLQNVPNVFRKHLDKLDNAYLDPSVGNTLSDRKNKETVAVQSQSSFEDSQSAEHSIKGMTYYNMSTDSLKKDATKDVWCLAIDQFWMEFVDVPSSRSRPVPFVESFPLSLWISRPKLKSHTKPETIPAHQRMNGHIVGEDYKPDENDKTQSGDLLMKYAEEEEDVASHDKLADIHIIAKIDTKVAMEINHYQYLFLLRLMETISNFQEELYDDTKCILQEKLVVKHQCIAILVQELEIALVCPPIPEVPSASLDSRDSSSMDIKEEELLEDEEKMNVIMARTRELCGDSALGTSIQSEEHGTDRSLSVPPNINKSHSDGEIVTSNSQDLNELNYPGYNTYNPHMSYDSQASQSGCEVAQVGVSEVSSVAACMANSHTPQQVSPLHRASVDTTSSNVSVGSAAEMAKDQRKSGEIRKSFNTAFSSFSKFTEKVKQNVQKDLLNIGEDVLSDDWETVSIKSGASSDDEEFVVLKLANAMEVPAFERRHSASETASVSAGSDGRDMDSANFPSGASERSRGVVSVVSFRMHGTEAVIQSRGEDFVVAAQVDHVIPKEYGNINLDKFQAKLASDSEPLENGPIQSVFNSTILTIAKGGREDDEEQKTYDKLPSAPVKLRYQVGPAAERLAPTAGKNGFLQTLIEKFSTTLLMSSLTNFADLIEDEIIPEAMPMVINITDSAITIKNDAPPTHPTSPGVIPLDVHVDNISVWRGPDNVFNVATGGKAPYGMDVARAVSFTRSDINQQQSHDATGQSQSAKQPSDPPQFPPGFDETLKNKVYSILDENELLKEKLSDVEKDKQQMSEKLHGDSGRSVKDLEHENDQLRRQLEKIAKLDGAAANENMQRELGHLRDQANLSESVQRENTQLLEQLAIEQDEVTMMKEERESLLAMIQMLQEELSASEHLRSRVSPIS